MSGPLTPDDDTHVTPTDVGHLESDPFPPLPETPDLPEDVTISLDLAGRIIGYLHLCAVAGDCEADGIAMKFDEEIRRQLGD